ncbi:MAG: NAD(P)H-dependent oxidoreductase, partial [Acidobacteriota bacterium]
MLGLFQNVDARRTAVILGHPDSESFTAHLALQYAEAAEAAGREVRFFRLGDLEFDPILRRGYRQRQELEADL